MRYIPDSDYDHRTKLKVGVLIVNLGTPTEPTPAAVRRYLREFLSDQRVIEIPRPIWWLILNLIILPFRARKSAHAYSTIWTDNGSPLLVNSSSISHALDKQLKMKWQNITVQFAMRYGTPKISDTLDSMRRQNVRRLLVLPLFPQYSSTTTAAVFDAVTDSLRKQRWLPELRFVNSYHDHPLYIKACATCIANHRSQHGSADKLMFSFHGLPKRNIINGDPYHCQCHKTARLIASELNLSDDQWLTCFQSRFGKAEWIKPYTDKTLIEIAQNSDDSVDVFCPGFAADCLETLEEIAMQNHEIYLNHSGKAFAYIPALNHSPSHTEALCEIISSHLSGWSDWDDASINSTQVRVAQDERAKALKAKYI